MKKMVPKCGSVICLLIFCIFVRTLCVPRKNKSCESFLYSMKNESSEKSSECDRKDVKQYCDDLLRIRNEICDLYFPKNIRNDTYSALLNDTRTLPVDVRNKSEICTAFKKLNDSGYLAEPDFGKRLISDEMFCALFCTDERTAAKCETLLRMYWVRKVLQEYQNKEKHDTEAQKKFSFAKANKANKPVTEPVPVKSPAPERNKQKEHPTDESMLQEITEIVSDNSANPSQDTQKGPTELTTKPSNKGKAFPAGENGHDPVNEVIETSKPKNGIGAENYKDKEKPKDNKTEAKIDQTKQNTQSKGTTSVMTTGLGNDGKRQENNVDEKISDVSEKLLGEMTITTEGDTEFGNQIHDFGDGYGEQVNEYQDGGLPDESEPPLAKVPTENGNNNEKSADENNSGKNNNDKKVKQGKISIEKQHPPFPEQEDSHFFAYFLAIVVLCIAGYLVFHNKQKIIALIVEGRHERRRRPNNGTYKRLDSKDGAKATSHVIF